MPVDISMYRQNPLRSMADYQSDYNKLDAQNQALQQGAISLQQTAPKFQAEMGLTAAKIAEQRSLSGLHDSQKVAADLDNQIKTTDTAIKDISNLTSVDEAFNSIIDHKAKGTIDAAKARQLISGLPQSTDPAEFDKWKRNLTLGLMDAKSRYEATRQKVSLANQGNQFQPINENPDAGPVGPIPGAAPIPINASPSAQLQADTSMANAEAQRNVAMRGQNMTDQRARDLQEAGKVQLTETPDGFVLVNKSTNQVTPLKTADGQPVRSNAQATKLEGAFNADRASLTGTASGLDRLREAAATLKASPGIAGITGLRGAIPDIPGSDAANAQTQFETLKSQIGFGVLQDMRQNSKTGGALGNVSDAEGKRLEANLAALSRKQSTEELVKNLDKVIEYTDTAKARLSDAFNMKHAQFLGRNPDAPKASVAAKIKSDEEYNALPSGALFTGPDGKTRRKP